MPEAKRFHVATYLLPDLPLRVSNVTCEIKPAKMTGEDEHLVFVEVTADRAHTAKRMAARERIERERSRRASA